MKQRTCLGWSWTICVAAALGLLAGPLWTVASDSPAVSMSTSNVAITQLAGKGRFDELLLRLSTADATDASHLGELKRDLQRYADHDKAAKQKRQDAAAAALTKLEEQTKTGKYKEALASAVEAHSQSLDSKALMTDPRVTELVQKTELAATEAANEGDWLEVLTLYRRLNLLFEPKSPYSKQNDQAEQRVRVLGTYAPQQLRRLHLDRIKRLGEQMPENADAEIDLDSWEKVLKGVTPAMLKDAFVFADGHVSGPKVSDLIRGGIDQLLLMSELKELTVTFPSLGDEEKVKAYRNRLTALRRDVSERREKLFAREIGRIIDQVLQANSDTVDLPRQVVVYELGEGAIGLLDDFSEMVWPYKVEQFERSTRGNFTGVGIQISTSEDNHIKVVTPIMNTPAHRAGLKPNDILVKVDGQDTTYWPLDKAVRKITGPVGSEVTLTVTRVGHEAPINYTLTRARIPIESVTGWERNADQTWNYYLDRSNKIGYLRVNQFIPQTADDMDAAIKSMQQDKGLSSLILDLRFNPGGLLSQAVEISNRFIPQGTIVSTVGSNDVPTSTYRAAAHKAYLELDVVVLINRGAASASEIVSGALQDYGRAFIVGTRSYGKGSVQDLYPIDFERAWLKLTTQYYKLPLGRIIHRKDGDETWGIEPDLVVEMTDQQIADSLDLRQKIDIVRDPKDGPAADEKGPAPKAVDILVQGADPQLEAAVLYLKTKLFAEQIKLALGEKALATP